ncbi:MAG: insulinase family protein, partial [Chloroflexota bacterium]
TRGHFQRHFGPMTATLIVVGDVSLDEIMEGAEAAFGGWRPQVPGHGEQQDRPDATSGDLPNSTTVFLVDKPEAAQSVISVGHSTVPRQHADYWGLTLLNYAFGGQFSARLNQNLRQDKGYSYGFHSSIQWHRGPSLLVAGGSVQTAVTKESVWETLQEFRHIHRSRPLTPEELEASKAGLLRGYPATFERPGQVLGHLVQWVVYDLPDSYFQTVSAKVAAVSLAEAHRIGAERVQPDGLKVLVVGDRQAVEPGLRELGLPLVFLDRDGGEVA